MLQLRKYLVDTSMCLKMMKGLITTWAAAATPMAASNNMLAPVRYSLATSPVDMIPNIGSMTTGNSEVTSSGNTLVVQNRAIKHMQLPHLTS